MCLTRNMSFPLGLGELNTVLELINKGANSHSTFRQSRLRMVTLLLDDRGHGHHTCWRFQGQVSSRRKDHQRMQEK